MTGRRRAQGCAAAPSGSRPADRSPKEGERTVRGRCRGVGSSSLRSPRVGGNDVHASTGTAARLLRAACGVRVRAAAPLGAASLGGCPSAPVVAVLHNLERPFLGHAGPALRGGGASSTSASCARAIPCPRSTRSTASWPSGASRPRPTPLWRARRRCCARPRRAASRCSASASAPRCSPTRTGAGSGGWPAAISTGSSCGRCRRPRVTRCSARSRRAPPGSTGTRTASPCRAGAVELLRSPAGSGEGFRARRALVGRAVPPRARRGRAGALVRRLAFGARRGRGRPRRTRAPPTACTSRASVRSRRPSSAVSPASSRTRAGRVCAHGRADLPRRRHRHRVRDLRRPRAARAAARHGPRDADDRLARGLLRASSPGTASTSSASTTATSAARPRCATCPCRRSRQLALRSKKAAGYTLRTWRATPSACSTTSASSARTSSAPRWAA